jgi:putative endonuclease
MNEIILQIKGKRMARHNDLGKWGEELAADWLIQKDFRILHRNWRHGRSEVDIIATRKDAYHFIEVKCGREDQYGYPEERVSKAKLRSIMRVAAHWLYEQKIPVERRIQYDVLAIRLAEGKAPEYSLFEDVSL